MLVKMCHFVNVYEDFDECEHETSDCDQICKNTEGSYECYCNAGFKPVDNACVGMYFLLSLM